MRQARILGVRGTHDPRPRRLYRARRQCAFRLGAGADLALRGAGLSSRGGARRHQQGAGDAGARRRPAAGRLRDGAAARPGRARARARPRRGAPAQSRRRRRRCRAQRRSRRAAASRSCSTAAIIRAARRLALARAGWADFPARQQAARAAGRHIGIGVANFVEGTGRGPFEPRHRAHRRLGQGASSIPAPRAMGQGTKTMLAQLVADALGGDMAQVTVTTGDSAAHRARHRRLQQPAGGDGRQLGASCRARGARQGAAIARASARGGGGRPRDRGRQGPRQGRARSWACARRGRARGRRHAGLQPAAGHRRRGSRRPSTSSSTPWPMPTAPPSPKSRSMSRPAASRSCASSSRMIAAAPSTRCSSRARSSAAAAHGIGNALFEWMGFDADASRSPRRSASICSSPRPRCRRSTLLHHESPSPLNPLGVKGVGEAGVIPTPAAIVAAIEDALAPFGVRIAQAPIRPHEIVALIAAARHA